MITTTLVINGGKLNRFVLLIHNNNSTHLHKFRTYEDALSYAINNRLSRMWATDDEVSE